MNLPPGVGNVERVNRFFKLFAVFCAVILVAFLVVDTYMMFLTGSKSNTTFSFVSTPGTPSTAPEARDSKAPPTGDTVVPPQPSAVEKKGQ